MTILEYLDVIKTYPMEDYFARYGEIEQVLKQAEEAIQKNPAETQKSLLQEIAGAYIVVLHEGERRRNLCTGAAGSDLRCFV